MREREGGGCNREFRDIGRRNDCRSCLFYCRGSLKGGGMCAAYNRYGRLGAGWQQQDKSNVGCKQQVGGKEDESEAEKHCSPDS